LEGAALSAPHEDEKTAATACRPPEEMSPKPFNFSSINFESPTFYLLLTTFTAFKGNQQQ
jgi:hypothetical protein